MTRLRYSLCNDITRTAEIRQFTMHPTRYLFIIVMIRTQPRPPWQADIPVYFLDGIAITCCFSKRYQYRQSPCRVRPVPATRGSGQAEHPGVSFFLMNFALESTPDDTWVPAQQRTPRRRDSASRISAPAANRPWAGGSGTGWNAVSWVSPNPPCALKPISVAVPKSL